eukprot:GHVT01097975.1.p1 GENE.GHVT01097975.1~~GHVT01097975.1.p1  ORF type:complete len:247 (-),score=3.66 GHVT01097975.1:331-1071(-)
MNHVSCLIQSPPVILGCRGAWGDCSTKSSVARLTDSSGWRRIERNSAYVSVGNLHRQRLRNDTGRNRVRMSDSAYVVRRIAPQMSFVKAHEIRKLTTEKIEQAIVDTRLEVSISGMHKSIFSPYYRPHHTWHAQRYLAQLLTTRNQRERELWREKALQRYEARMKGKSETGDNLQPKLTNYRQSHNSTDFAGDWEKYVDKKFENPYQYVYIDPRMVTPRNDTKPNPVPRGGPGLLNFMLESASVPQ